MSIANEHTPRPWRRDNVYGCMVKAGQRYIADTWQLRDTPEERDEDFANARLIVNAPDLLSQLEIAVASGKSWRGISEARAAIAKARGQNV